MDSSSSASLSSTSSESEAVTEFQDKVGDEINDLYEKKKREQILGYKPQKEIVFNRFLPYAELLDVESAKHFEEIKCNLSKAILFKEFRPSGVHWCNKLVKYINVHGFKFSKQIHVDFVKLFYELATTENMEPMLRMKFIHVLTTLLKKRNLLSREDLELPWKPLYELYMEICYGKKGEYALVFLPESIDGNLRNLIRVCRVYFSVESTKEMLSEWRPLLCPFDMSMLKGITFLELFLPTCLPPQQFEYGFKLWFDELMTIWKSTYNSPSWEHGLMNLFARIAQDACGYIDWNPYIPMFFTRLLRTFDLPVSFAGIQMSHTHPRQYELHTSVRLIIAAMGGDNCVAIEHIEKLLRAIHSYYYPSNIGKWHIKLSQLLRLLPDHFIQRLHKERYRKETWENKVPHWKKITEEEITRFVTAFKPIVLVAMFSKFGSQDASAALHNLATLRPEIIIPPVLERLYPALEGLLEPHRLTATLNCIVAVARNMLEGSKHYPDGPSHAVKLLMLALPGIDANDFRKSMVTFQFMSSFTTLIPIVDCSDAIFRRNDLTDTEKEVCSQTAAFEDFILQFMDRCFALIENCTEIHVAQTSRDEIRRFNNEEAMLQMGISSTVNAILCQCSPSIYNAALEKLAIFVKSHVMETQVAGRLVADMVRACAKVDAAAALHTFLPHLTKMILMLTEKAEVQKEENLDDELLWNIQIVSEIVRCDGGEVLKYKEDLFKILKSTMYLTCKRGYKLSCILARHILKCMCSHYPQEYRSLPFAYTKPVEEFLPIRYWAQPGDMHNVNMQWHMPSKEEKMCVQELLETFMLPELAKINEHVAGTSILSRDNLQQSLYVVGECLYGAASQLPAWDSEIVYPTKSIVPYHSFEHVVSREGTLRECGIRLTWENKNARQLIADCLKHLVNHILMTAEDDTKSLGHVIRIYNFLMFYHGTVKEDFANRFKSYRFIKKALENKLIGRKRHIRSLIIERILLQHEMRILEKTSPNFTKSHEDLMMDLIRLSTSHYSEVRKQAQSVLSLVMQSFPGIYKLVVPHVVALLKEDKDISHEQFKGALYIIQSPAKQRSMTVHHDWKTVHDIWPALVEAQHSEKPSVTKILERIGEKIMKKVDTLQLDLEISEKCEEAVKIILADNQPNDEEITIAELGWKEQESTNKHFYASLVGKLVCLVQSGKLRWRHELMACAMLSMMVRDDTPFSSEATQIFVNNLTHDALLMRKISMTAVATILKQQRLFRSRKKIDFEPFVISGVDPPAENGLCRPGYRKDNAFMQYSSTDIPKTEEEWMKHPFIHKTYHGYYSWPVKFKYFAPAHQQESLRIPVEEMTVNERIIHASFTKAEFVEKLITFYSLEEHKGHDKFDAAKYRLFRGLFRKFGDLFLDSFRPHLEKLVVNKQESHQRCAAEIIAGFLRGSKHWTFDMLKNLKEFLVPILRKVMSNMTQETYMDWGTCIATCSEDMDPNFHHWLHEVLMENPIAQEEVSFLVAARIFLLLGSIGQQEWRACELLQKALEMVKPHLSHPYKNVRDKIGSMLSTVFLYETDHPSTSPLPITKRQELIEELLPRLKILEQATVDEGVISKSTSKESMDVSEEAISAKMSHLQTDISMTSGAGISGEAPALTASGSPLSGIQMTPEMMKMLKNIDSFSSEEKGALMASISGAMMEKLQGGSMMGHMQSRSRTKELVMPTAEQSDMDENEKDDSTDEKKVALRLSQTIMKWIIHSHGRSSYPAPPEIFKLLPTICLLDSETLEEDVRQEMHYTMAALGSSLLKAENIPIVLKIVKQISCCKNWHARSSILSYIQLMIFSNMFTIMKEDYCQEVGSIVMDLLLDSQLEVRVKASTTLSGLIHTSYLTVNQNHLIQTFTQWASTKFVKRRHGTEISTQSTESNNRNIVQRHGGVLGLCSFVSAYPYDVPEFMPGLLVVLSDHVNDPQPIRSTVKKVLSDFKRTHHDNWQEHKLKFTDDQLAILTDLLVSPTYYA